jgi:hypothetical protein
MSVRARVERLESDPRVPEPCWFCELVGRATRIFNDYLTARGVVLPEPVCVDEVCRYCGATKPTNVTGLTPDDLEARSRYWAALDADDPRAEELLEELISRCEARGVATFGEHYVGACEAADNYITRWFDENADRLKEAA